jgi:hypothetical protein
VRLYKKAMEYLIFSDESGHWNEGNYYLRSWIKISPINYTLLRKEIVFLKNETGIRELKWKSFKNNIRNAEHAIASIKNIEFSVFVTLSIPGHFQSRVKDHKYIILRTLQGIKLEQSTGGEQFTEAIKNKIISAAQHTIFYSFFERQHIENAKKALVADIPTEGFKFIIDSPQCLDKDWAEIANECGIVDVEIEKESKKIPGIELADIVAGCIHECIIGEEQAKTYYQEHIKDKMLDMRSRKLPNPNLIFFSDFSEDEKKRVNIFR